MKVTNFGPGSFPKPLAGWSTGATSVNSNFNTEDGGLSATNFVQAVTVNGSNMLLRPIANIASGSNILLTVDAGPGGSSPSNTVRIHSTSTGGSGTISAGSNSTAVREISTAGASTTLWSPFDHAHEGVSKITASSSNTMQRGTFNLRQGTNIVFALADSDSDGEFDTLTLSSQLAGGGSANDHNENAAAALVNATTAGDAGNRSDQFNGAALSGNWTQEATALSSGPTVEYSVFSGTSGGNATHYLQSFTPSGAFRIEMRAWAKTTTSLSGICILARDSGTGDASGNGVAAWYTFNAGLNSIRVVTLDTGTYTSRASANIANDGSGAMRMIYVALTRDGSNNWYASASFDRVGWVDTSTTAKTVTIAKAGIRWSINCLAGIDFWDVVS